MRIRRERAPLRWVPSSAADLIARGRRIRTADDSIIAGDAWIAGLFTIGLPIFILWGAPTPISVRVPAAIVFALFFFLVFLFLLNGVYLSTAGVRVWNFVLPRRRIPWHEVAEFRLVRRTARTDWRDQQWFSVVTIDGRIQRHYALNRYVTFEDDRAIPLNDSDKDRSLPELVDQLNAITREMQRREPEP